MCEGKKVTGRRRFLAQAAAVTAVGAAASRLTLSAEKPAAAMPTIALGKHRVSRLIAGCNPVLGYSYLGRHMDAHMKEFFTPERTVVFLKDCERAGITTFQFSSSPKVFSVLRTVRESGSKLQFIGLHAGADGIGKMVSSARPIALVHHGGVTDRLFAQGKSAEVRDYVKKVRDQGILAGVSAHNPDCIKRIADEGWDVDFFMTCFYFLTRKKGGPKKPETLSIAYHFYEGDPQAMTAVVRQVKQPCLGFKILAAGRRCSNPQAVRTAFQFAFEHIKPSDGVIVGMYPRFSDEIGSNAQYVREFGRRERRVS